MYACVTTVMSQHISIVALTLDKRIRLVNSVSNQGAAWIEALMVAMRLRYNSSMARWVVNSCLRVLGILLNNSVVVSPVGLHMYYMVAGMVIDTLTVFGEEVVCFQLWILCPVNDVIGNSYA